VSVDFNAVFALGAGFESADRLRAQLAEEPPGLRETVEKYRSWWRPQEWTLQPARTEPPRWVGIVGPGGFALTISPCAASLYHLMPFFRVFTADAEARALLRRSCLVISELLGSPHALLMPELTPDGFFDGLSLGEMEATLREKIGPPASTLEELHEAEHFGPGSWYVDNFSDLR
jgi:hypothetical protein